MSLADDQESIQLWLLDVCRELGLDTASGDDDFFAVGGTSLTAIKLISRAEEKFGEDTLPPDDLFESSRIREIAATVARNSGRANAHDA